MSFPGAVRQGDTLQWSTPPGATPGGAVISAAAGWSLVTTVRFTVATGATEATGVAQGDGWLSTVSVGLTALFPLQRGSWQARATKAGEAFTIGNGGFDVLPSLAAAAAIDTRGRARRDWEACRDAITDIATKGGEQEYRFEGRSRKRYDLPALLKLEGQLRAEMLREEAAQNIKNGRGNPNALYVRFV